MIAEEGSGGDGAVTAALQMVNAMRFFVSYLLSDSQVRWKAGQDAVAWLCDDGRPTERDLGVTDRRVVWRARWMSGRGEVVKCRGSEGGREGYCRRFRDEVCVV